MRSCLILLIIGGSLLFNTNLFGQEAGEIRGFVYDKATGEPIIFNNVKIVDTDKGASTNADGFFSISPLPADTFTLRSTYLGYDTAYQTVSVGKGEIRTIELYLKERGINVNEVEVTGEKTTRQKNVKVSKINVTPEKVAKVPSIGAPDFAQYLRVMPGVVSTGDQGGQVYIRGGTPIQNKVLMDGMTIYNPFHSIGLFSVFDMDIVRSIDVYSGGFDATYGNRISAIMDIKTKDGNRKRTGGKISMSPFTSKVMVEGPIKKWEPGAGSASFLFNSRISYLDQSSEVFYQYADSSGIPYNFQDFYGKLSFNSPGGSSVDFFGFSFHDQVDYREVTTYEWDANGGGMQFMLLPSQSSTTIEGNFAYSDYHIEQQQGDNLPRFSEIRGFEAGMDFNYYPGDDEVKYGFDITGFKTEFQFYNAVGRRLNQTQFTTEIAGYVKYKKILGPLVLDPSVRLQYYGSLQELSPEPRLGAKINITNDFRVKFSCGYYTQNLLSAKSERDVVNLFYGFLSAPNDLQDKFQGDEVNSHLQEATHAIGGIEADITPHMLLEAETYVKRFNQLIDVNRNKIFDDNRQYQDKPAYLREDYIIEEGLAYGADLKYSYDKSPYYFWLTYSLGFVDRNDGRVEYDPHWDRRHSLNLVGNYTFGNNNSWEVSLRWNLGSGFPFTRTQGFYENLKFLDQGVNTQYTRENGELGIIYEKINEGRMPYYHRLDASINKELRFDKHQMLKFNLSIINMYNRNNIFFFDRVRYERIDQLPILPSLVVSYTF